MNSTDALNHFPDDVLPPEGDFPLRKDLVTAINAWARELGYAFVVLHLAANHSRRLTALDIAVQGNFMHATEEIVALTDVIQLTTQDDQRRTTLHIAAEQAFIDIVRILLERMHTDHVWNAGIMGDTELQKAAASGYRDAVKSILGNVVDGDDL
ncbi:hypothetical protein FBEOM_6865 [Fusarium beomiforme]|uniref:Ankyrin repeat protein n=1 Tax=Fusarium beomiforme TaxID=44412 RepID=A0A9P5AIG7_9HYPO|nr:hypothetical protein FBEOM_6865 [Fusarium beomiforme]